MIEHTFGGPWTEIKLDAVQYYLECYTRALKRVDIDDCLERVPQLPLHHDLLHRFYRQFSLPTLSLVSKMHQKASVILMPYIHYLLFSLLETSCAMDDDFTIQGRVRLNSRDEVIARSANLLVGRAAYETARRLYPRDRIDYRNGAQIIERSDD
jgi:hypothetical protein